MISRRDGARNTKEGKTGGSASCRELSNRRLSYIWVTQIDDASVLLVWKDSPESSKVNASTDVLSVPSSRTAEKVKPVPEMPLEGEIGMENLSLFAGPLY